MWDELLGEADAEGVVVIVCPLPAEARPGVYWPKAGRAYVLIHDQLELRERTVVLAHELEHHRRGGGADADGMPPSWNACVARDEAAVQTATVRRVVDFDDLGELVDAAVAFDHPLTAAEVAGEYAISVPDAELALRLLWHDRDARGQRSA